MEVQKFKTFNCKNKSLASIQSPLDLKQLAISDLNSLASEIRKRIIDVVTFNGGHLSSNLGVVELTVALHYVFSSPIDKILFDVSHQTYAHKLLTGRNDERFDRIRKSQGLSGFADPKESNHDLFFSGHAGAALSLALGLAKRRDLSHSEGHVIPIIGDGAFTSGLSFEALNNIPPHLSRLIILLNDNEFSISKNVGAIPFILSDHKMASRFFEQLGLTYVGPIDGHNIPKMIRTFESLQNLEMPVLVHLKTRKGMGLNEAERSPDLFHGVKSSQQTRNDQSFPKPTFPKLFGNHLTTMGEKDPTITLVTPAMSLGSSLTSFFQKFPHRSFDVGIAEGHAVSFSGGLAKGKKLKVVTSIYSTFLQRAYDNLFQEITLQGSPLLFAIDRAGLSPGDGPTHHGIYDMAFLKSLPNMVICQPRNGQLLKELMESAFIWDRPVALRYPNLETKEGNSPLDYRPLGKGEIMADGDDVVIVALGHMVDIALEAREILQKKGINATVVDPIFIKPLDQPLFTSLFSRINRVVTVEEHALKGGLGCEINSFILSHRFNSMEVLNIGLPDIFFDHKEYKELMDELGLTGEKIAMRLINHFYLSPSPMGSFR